MLEYSPANTKLKELYNVPELQSWLQDGLKVYSLDLLSGWSCPSAKDCLSKVIELPTGKKAIKDGPETEFRCFSASQEVVYPGVYRRRKHNYDTLRNLSIGGMIHELNYSLPKDTGILRYHVGGDFFNSKYFFAAITIALMNPDKLFYAYTKSLKYWIKYRQWADTAENLILTASRGGRDDSLIDSEGLRESVVVFSEAEAKEKGLEIDHDDSHAAVPDWEYDNFALLVHGVQPAGSEAGKAVKALKGKGSYGRKKKEKTNG
tara:strand:- start:1329 stop:2114 length:786 start_codon:yes stop_codon:yes gene_type:complete